MQVVVLGAGYAGVTLVRRLERTLPEAVDVAVVDEDDSHLVQHQLHRVVRRPELAAEIEIPLASLFDRAEIRTSRVRAIDFESGAAQLTVSGRDANGEVASNDDSDGMGTIDWDIGAVCLGARTEDFGLPGIAEHGRPLKRLEDAHAIHDAVEPLIAAGDGRVAVGGAGLSGIQVAGELAAWAAEAGATDLDVVLLEQADSVAPGFPDPFRAAVRRALVEAGVDVRTGTTITGAEPGEVTLANGGPVEVDELVWTGGIRGPDALESNRPEVRADLRLGPDTFGVGDAVHAVDADGEPVPATAQAAVAAAKTAATNVTRRVEFHREGGVFEPRLEQFRFEPRGWVVSVGDEAVALLGDEVVTGPAAKVLKAQIGTAYREGPISAAVDAIVDVVTGGGS